MPLIDQQKHRRFLKTHLPLNALPFFPEVKYIYVARHGLDIFMSWYNHYLNFADEFLEDLNGPGLIGDPIPPCPDDIHKAFDNWISKGWAEWETDGYPLWSLFYHVD